MRAACERPGERPLRRADRRRAAETLARNVARKPRVPWPIASCAGRRHAFGTPIARVRIRQTGLLRAWSDAIVSPVTSSTKRHGHFDYRRKNKTGFGESVKRRLPWKRLVVVITGSYLRGCDKDNDKKTARMIAR